MRNTSLICYDQETIEAQMYYGGIERAQAMMAKAEEGKRAHDLPYAKEVFRDYVIPLALAIAADVNVKAARRRQAHIQLLDGLDFDAVAFLAIRYVFSTQMSNKPDNHRQLAYGIGRTIQQELLLAQVEDFNPELYHTLVRDMGRRQSKDARYRTTVMRMQAQKAGIVFTEWPVGARDQVGMYIMDLLCQANFIEIGEEMRTGYHRDAREVTIHPDLIERISQVKDYIVGSMPVYGPCIVPPVDWTAPNNGGYHTKELRRSNRYLVHASSPTVREHVGKADMPVVLAAVNALQRTAWAVNEQVLDTVYKVAKEFSTDEIVSMSDKPKPPAPVWLQPGMKTEDMDESQQAMFKQWKRSVADWHTARKLQATKFARFYSATRQAEMFRHHAAIYFVYFADSRGRLYPMTYGLNPQGSDLGKSLLRFSEGLPLPDEQAVRWFHVQGANKWGFDKATLADRHAWVVERSQMFVDFAADPIANRGWTEAGDPLQFLAWCFEYKRYIDNPSTFLSYLPISMDGSCNGLQNLSALFRDEIGGQATNLTNNEVMEDIYRRVAEAALVRLKDIPLEPEHEVYRQKWLEHGISRKVVKRSVMTTPYGVTRLSATDYVVSDYLADPSVQHPFGNERRDLNMAAQVLMKAVWPAIGDVVVKGREAMDWLKKAARQIVKGFPEGVEPVIKWDTPSGFPASQAYFEEHIHRITTRLHGEQRIRVLSESDVPDCTKHASGLAPNFVHSMDAAHLHLTTAAASSRGIDALAMIHDDYGTHAANAQKLFEHIRQQFVCMYDGNDPIEDFCLRYTGIAKPPTKGSLNIYDVLKSDFFFS